MAALGVTGLMIFDATIVAFGVAMVSLVAWTVYGLVRTPSSELEAVARSLGMRYGRVARYTDSSPASRLANSTQPMCLCGYAMGSMVRIYEQQHYVRPQYWMRVDVVCVIEPVSAPDFTISTRGGLAAKVFDTAWWYFDSRLPTTITTGDARFDRRFVVRCRDEQSTLRLLRPPLRDALRVACGSRARFRVSAEAVQVAIRFASRLNRRSAARTAALALVFVESANGVERSTPPVSPVLFTPDASPPPSEGG